MNTYETPISFCPVCRGKLDRALQNAPRAPAVGDFSICCHCGAVLRFREGFTLTLATHPELNDLEPEQRMRMLIAARLIQVTKRDRRYAAHRRN